MKQKSGFTLIEVLVGMSLLMVVTVGLIQLLQLSVGSSAQAKMIVEYNTILKKTMEEVMAVRASNFGNLNEGIFHPENQGNTWVLAAGKEDLGQVSRWVEISKVQRQISCVGERVCPIVKSGGVVDPVTFRAKVTVEWQDREELKQEKLESLLSFWR